MKKICVFLLLFVCFSSCAQKKTLHLKNKREFDAFCTTPLYQKYGNVKAIKVLYHLKNKTLYYMNGADYQFHYEFAQQQFEPHLNLLEFNQKNYGNTPDRAYLLGNINYYAAQKRYVLEIGPSDQMSAQHLHTLFNAVKETAYFGEELYFFTNTNNAHKIIDELPHILRITPEDIYANQSYQPIHKGNKVGDLRIIQNLAQELASIKSTDILVLNETPNYLPVCAGVLVSKFQTPLSHISLLGKNRKIPICAQKDLFSLLHVKALDGKRVTFTVKQDTFYLEKSSAPLSALKPKKNKLRFDLTVDSLITLSGYNHTFRDAIGSKSNNFSRLVSYAENMDFKTPESAFAIPFYFYHQHVKQSGAQKLIEQLLAHSHFTKIQKNQLLASIREAILTHPVSDQLLTATENKIKHLGKYQRMRFRSSTNAEDLKGFNGAGLYLSKTGILNSKEKPISEAILKVWASTWSEKAFYERELFKLAQTDVKMAILVHRSFPNEEVNGVAITTNLYRKDYIGFVLNMQQGNINVVNQKDNIEVEQLIVYPSTSSSQNQIYYDIISYSTFLPGETLLTEKELNQLSHVLESIKVKYYREQYKASNYYNFALDLEFKIDYQTRDLYIKQMREY